VKHPFQSTTAAHTVVRVAEQLGWNLADPEHFLRRVQHVEFGLSAELEFAALLRWLGTCPFVHRLSEDVLEDASQKVWQVPDLFAVFSANGQICSTLIEVKTTDDGVLKFKKDYLEHLQAYARLLSQPLLIAWHPRNIGFWMLVDPLHAHTVDGEIFVLNIETAMKNDLMGVLAGDFYITPMKGAGLRIEADRVSEKEPAEGGYKAVYQIEKAYLHDSGGNRMEDVPNSIFWIIVSAMEDRQRVTDHGIVESFLASGGMTRAQSVLRTAVGFPLSEDQRIHWKAVGTNLNLIISSTELRSDAQAHFGTFVQYIFNQQPQVMPGFLPQAWRNGLGRSGSERK